MMSDDHAIRDLLPGYALGCLDAQDERAVASHIQTCPQCREDLRSYARVTDQLVSSVPPAEPPAGLERRLMSAIRRRPARFVAWRQPLTAVAAVVAVALISGNILQWNGVIHRPGPVSAAALVTATLAGTGDARGAFGTVVLDQADREGVLAVTGLALLDSAHQYQVWLVRGGERRSAGVFSVNEEGYGSLVLAVPADFRDFRSMGISVEPMGGSPAPTGARVMTGSL